MEPAENQGDSLRPPSSIPTRLLFIVWLVASLSFAWLIVYIMLYGGTPDRTNLAGDLGAIWGGTAAFLIVPGWKALKRWQSPNKKLILSGVVTILVFVGVYLVVRVRHTAKLETLFKEDHELEVNAAPEKRHFMKLLREKENAKDLPEYLQRCAELEPAVNDYETVERQVDNLVSQMQQEISELKPQGSYSSLLPGFTVLRAVFAKDIEGAEANRKEIEYAKQLPGIPVTDRIQFYKANIQPAVEQESKIAQDEFAILKDAKARGVKIPESIYRDAGIK